MWWLQSLSLSGGGEAEWRKTTIKEREMSPRDWQLCRQGGKKKKIPCTPFRVHSQKDKHHLICKRLPFGDDKKKKKMWLEETLTWKSPDPVLRTCVTFSAVSAAGLQGNWVLGFYKQCGGLGWEGDSASTLPGVICWCPVDVFNRHNSCVCFKLSQLCVCVCVCVCVCARARV